jgi:hypothetical protein
MLQRLMACGSAGLQLPQTCGSQTRLKRGKKMTIKKMTPKKPNKKSKMLRKAKKLEATKTLYYYKIHM